MALLQHNKTLPECCIRIQALPQIVYFADFWIIAFGSNLTKRLSMRSILLYLLHQVPKHDCVVIVRRVLVVKNLPSSYANTLLRWPGHVLLQLAQSLGRSIYWVWDENDACDFR